MALCGLGRALFDINSGSILNSATAPIGSTPEPLPDLATVTRSEWPALVTLRQPVTFVSEKDAGSTSEAPVGTVVKLTALTPDSITLDFKGAKAIAKPRVCDVAQRIRDTRKAKATADEQERTAAKATKEKAEAERKAAAEIEKNKLEAELGPMPWVGSSENATPPVEAQLYLKHTLRDPDSLQFVQTWPPVAETYQGRRCWAVTFRYRAKNGFSGYNVQDATAYFFKEKFLGIKQR
ncbi:MAG: hypothetical protein JWL59_3107 [Chthoniobacteraceae bacterium]|nr:hypothetical protein [Chthoniobacteraceae bacterium]